MWRDLSSRARVTFTSPANRDRLIAAPIREHLSQNARNSALDAKAYASQVWLLGSAAPYLSARTAKTFLQTSPDLPKRKSTALLTVIKELGYIGHVRKAMLVLCAACWGIVVFSIMRSHRPPEPQSAPALPTEEMASAPLEIKQGDISIKLYEGEELNRLLRSACKEYFTAQDSLEGVALQTCLNKRGTSLKESGISDYLETVTTATQEVSAESWEEAKALLLSAGQTAQPHFQTVSTYKDDQRVAFASGKKQGQHQIPYYDYSRQVYWAPEVEPPQYLREFDALLVPSIFAGASETLPFDHIQKPLQYRVILHPSEGKPEVLYFREEPILAADYFPNNKYIGAYSLFRHFEPDIDQAVGILSRFHGSELTPAQLKVVLAGKLLLEQVALRYEDPWQDRCACRWAGCDRQELIEAAYEQVEKGIKFVGHVVDLPCLSWEAASNWGTENWRYEPLEKQGFGPYQVIVGLLKEAAENQTVREHFAGLVTQADFQDDRALVRTIFEKPTFAEAFLLDYVLTRLEETTFADPKMRLGKALLPPFFSDPHLARQVSLMETAFLAVGVPERSQDLGRFAPMYAAYPPYWQYINQIIDGEDLFPGIIVSERRITSNQGQFVSYTFIDPELLR